MSEIQVFYSYNIYDSNNKRVGYGSGAMIGEKGKVWQMVMDEICNDRMCEYKNIHLISFNTL